MNLDLAPALTRLDLVADPVRTALESWSGADRVQVAEIDPELSNTAAFCERYDVGLDISANCVVLSGKREGEVRTAAALVLATTRADVNNVARRLLDVRKISFAPMEEVVAQTRMEYGGITPIGLPADWRILVDPRVVACESIIIGAGIRKAKLLVPGELVPSLPNVEVVEGLAQPIA